MDPYIEARLHPRQVRRHKFQKRRSIDVVSRQIIDLLNSLTEDQRLNIFNAYCKACGSSNPACTCQRDE